MFFGLQPWHIAVIVIVALLIFGPRRLPEVGRWVGKSITEFRKGSQEMTNALREGMNEGQQAEAQKNTIAQPAPAQSVPAGDSKFCIKCGAPNPQEALFCNKCGNPFQPQA
jgi:sec-independent protein translocase protein TatA